MASTKREVEVLLGAQRIRQRRKSAVKQLHSLTKATRFTSYDVLVLPDEELAQWTDGKPDMFAGRDSSLEKHKELAGPTSRQSPVMDQISLTARVDGEGHPRAVPTST